MNIETNEEMFFDKIKNVFKEVLSTVGLSREEDLAANSGFTSVEDYQNEVEAIKAELEEQTAEPIAEPTPEPEPKPAEPVVEEPKPSEEPKVEEPKPAEPDAANATQDATHPEPEPTQDNHLEELINSLKEEVEALKKMNSGLNSKVKELSKQPSAQPVNVNAKPTGVGSDTYAQWRKQMASYLGY